MAGSEPFITTLSTKGQVILPKAIRRAMRWESGTRLVVEPALPPDLSNRLTSGANPLIPHGLKIRRARTLSLPLVACYPRPVR